MTGSDLIVLAPWIIFGVGLAAVCVRLFFLRRSSRRAGRARRARRVPRHQEAAGTAVAGSQG